MKGKPKNKPRIDQSISEMKRAFGLQQPLYPLISMLDYSQVQSTSEMLAPPS